MTLLPKEYLKHNVSKYNTKILTYFNFFVKYFKKGKLKNNEYFLQNHTSILRCDEYSSIWHRKPRFIR